MTRGISNVIAPIDSAASLSCRLPPIAHAVAALADVENSLTAPIAALLFCLRASSHLDSQKRSHGSAIGGTFLARTGIKPTVRGFLFILVHLIHYLASRNERHTILSDFGGEVCYE